MPNGPFFSSVRTNTATPSVTASDPPETSMVSTQTTITLAPRKWEIGNDDASSNGWENTGSTRTRVVSSGAGGFYVNGTLYNLVSPAGALYACATADNILPTNGNPRNGGFEESSGPTLNGTGSAGPSNRWRVVGQNSTVLITEITAGKSGTTQGLGPHTDGGTKYGYIRLSTLTSGTSTRIFIRIMDAATGTQLVDQTASAFSQPGSGSSQQAITYAVSTLNTGSVAAGRSIRVRLGVEQNTTSPSFFAYFESDAFTCSGTDAQVFWARNSNIGGGETADIYFDAWTFGRADYATNVHEFISQEIRMPTSTWTPTREAITKTWFEIGIDADIPATPTGHGAAIAILARTGATTGLAYSAMDPEVQLVAAHTTTGMNQGDGGRGSDGNAPSSTLTFRIDGSPNLTARPFIRLRIVLNNAVTAPSLTSDTGTVSPVIKRAWVKFFNADNNFWWSQELDLGPQASGWGILNATSTAAGATISYAVRAAASLAALRTTAWTAVTAGLASGAGSLAAYAFNRYAQISARIVPAANAAAYGTTTACLPFIDAVSISWLNANETASAPPASAWHDKRYLLSVQNRNRTLNDMVLVLDRNLAWSKWENLNALALAVFKDKLLIGSMRAPWFGTTAPANLADGRICLFGSQDSDDGIGIYWHVRSRDFPSPDLRSPATVRGIEILGRAMAPDSFPQMGSPGSGTGWQVVPGTVWAEPIIGGQSQFNASADFQGAGNEWVYIGCPANHWAPTIGVLVYGFDIGKRSQIDMINLNVWLKEPQNR